MQWKNHTKEVPDGAHAFLSPSNYHWLRYDKEKLLSVYANQLATLRGTQLHAFAAQAITLGQKLPKTHQTLNMYVNDAIGFHLQPEQKLYYSPYCFGTADAIGFSKSFLRIHDLKTGVTKASFDQLLIYAALFCLDYGIRPADLKGCEARIYQNDDIQITTFETDDIVPVIDKIVTFDQMISDFKEDEYLGF